jgi:glycosyltransferase involved in cell wall biosynthesis
MDCADPENVQVIVVDDHSTDETEQVMQPWLTSRQNITYHKLEHNVRPGPARNIGISLAL